MSPGISLSNVFQWPMVIGCLGDKARVGAESYVVTTDGTLQITYRNLGHFPPVPCLSYSKLKKVAQHCGDIHRNGFFNCTTVPFLMGIETVLPCHF